VKLQTFRREFETLIMKGNESIHDFISRVMVFINHMKTFGESISDQKAEDSINSYRKKVSAFLSSYLQMSAHLTSANPL